MKKIEVYLLEDKSDLSAGGTTEWIYKENLTVEDAIMNHSGTVTIKFVWFNEEKNMHYCTIIPSYTDDNILSEKIAGEVWKKIKQQFLKQ